MVLNSQPITTPPATIPVLVLAAGASRRMGCGKQMLSWGSGSLLDHAIDQARALSDQVLVVAGARYPLVRYRTRSQPSRWIYAGQWRRGLSASLRSGLEHVGGQCPGVFIMLGDQPMVSLSDLGEMKRRAYRRPEEPLAADYQGCPGVPAYLPKSLWPAIRRLEGDQGAGRVLRAVEARRLVIAGVDADVDTRDDWEAQRRALARAAG